MFLLRVTAATGEAKPLAYLRGAAVEERPQGDNAGAEDAEVGLYDAVEGAADLVVGAVLGVGGLHDGEKTENGDDAGPATACQPGKAGGGKKPR